MTRRELLELSALSASVLPLASTCKSEDEQSEGPMVAVIGAGIAGLHCAYRLDQAGVSLRVFESSKRVGGRMYTVRDKFPDKQVAELGGELIDTNHRFMRALVEELGLELDDRLQDAPDGYAVDTWFVNDAIVSEETIVEQFKAVADRMADDMAAADDDDDEFTRLDETTLADYLEQVVPADDYPELHAVLTSAYRGEFGLECEEQSALNMIYLIGSDDPDPFRIFGESDERYHVRGGNDQIPRALADPIEHLIEKDARLVEAKQVGERYELTFQRADDSLFEQSFERVVFALPFTTLRLVDLSALGLSDDKLEVIGQLGYGTNVKVMGAFRSRIWREQYNASGAVTCDRPIQQTWDTAIGQSGEHGLLTNFLGGDQGVASGEGSAEQWMQSVLPDLDDIFPGAADEYVEDSAQRMHWPTQKHTLGSYACYRPGQWSYWATEGLREGNLHFCGEHTSPEFQGWMEGAAESGGRVAKEILDDLEIDLPNALSAVIDDDALLPAAPRLPFPRRYLRVRGV